MKFRFKYDRRWPIHVQRKRVTFFKRGTPPRYRDVTIPVINTTNGTFSASVSCDDPSLAVEYDEGIKAIRVSVAPGVNEADPTQMRKSAFRVLMRAESGATYVDEIAVRVFEGENTEPPFQYDSEYRSACGAVAALVACEYHNIPTSLDEMIALTATTNRGGTTLLNVKEALEQKGLQCEGIRIDPQDLRALHSATFILPTAEEGEGYDHFLFGVNHCGFVAICDLKGAIRFADVDVLKRKWHGHLLLVGKEQTRDLLTVERVEERISQASDLLYVKGMPFVWIEPGEFRKANGEKGEVTNGFYMSQFEFPYLCLLQFARETGYGVTREHPCEEGWVDQIKSIKNEDLLRPVTRVTYVTAEKVASWLAPDAALPTYSQWMLAYQNGTSDHYPWGNAQKPLSKFVARKRARRIGTNPLDVTKAGLYDMFSNAREIVTGGQIDVIQPPNDEESISMYLQYRLALGTGYEDKLPKGPTQPAYRLVNDEMSGITVGFRLVLNRERVLSEESRRK